MKRNAGFTLVELIVGIAVASIVTAAATTMLLMGLRMNKASSDTATRQNTARIVLTMLEDIASEQIVKLEGDSASGNSDWKILRDGGTPLLTCDYIDTDETAIYIGAASDTPILTVEKATAKKEEDILTITLVTEDGEFSSSVYCRIKTLVEGSANPHTSNGQSVSAMIAATKLESTLPARQNFLNILTAELGSTGASRATGEYFSEWYIGSYEENPAWSPETPWCACFLSWALEQCSGDIRGWVPRYANVDAFMDSFDWDDWKTEAPEPGDIVFFDWQAPYDDPEHVGAVTEVRDGAVYTIEGNSNGKVENRCYSLDDPRILGYGILNWK